MADVLKVNAVPGFDDHRWDPKELIHPDWLSDYVSEPEDEEETKEEWKIRMAKASGIDHELMDVKQWDALKFWERVRPAW